MIERHQLAHADQVRLGKERVRPEALRKALRPAGSTPPQVADEPAAERRQLLSPLGAFRLERSAQLLQRLAARAQRQPRIAHADVAVPPERALEEERVVRLRLVEKTEDAERRQQITG